MFSKSLKIIVLAMVIISNGFVAQAQLKAPNITVEFLKSKLKGASPKLIITPQLVKNLKSEVKTDPLVKAYYENLVLEADKIMKSPLISNKLNGFRMPAARISYGNLGILTTVYLVNNDPKILTRVNDELINLCNYPNWNTQHFIDTGQMAMGVALAIDWLGKDLPAATIALAKKYLIEKAILPSFNTTAIRMENVINTHHWSAACNGGMIAASIMIADVDPELAAKTINVSLAKMSKSLAQYGPDGTHPEGILYWRFSTSLFVLTAQALQTAFGSDFGILKAPGFRESAMFRLMGNAPSGEMYTFADADGPMDGETKLLLAWFAAQSGDALYLDKKYFENGAKGGGRNAGYGLLWLSQFKEKSHSSLPLTWVGQGDSPAAIFRAEATDEKQFYLGLKGSSPIGDHQDMDAGSFIFELNEVRWVIDPGNQDYGALDNVGFDVYGRCQDCERWTLFSKGNQGHSTILVNNERFNVTKTAPIINFNDKNKPTATVEMTQVLNGFVNSATRKFSKESDDALLIEDSIQVNDKTKEVTWQIMTVAEVQPTKNGAVLKQNGKELYLEILSPSNLNVTIVSLDPPPLEIDKKIENLKRVEIKVPSYVLKANGGVIKVRLSDQKSK